MKLSNGNLYKRLFGAAVLVAFSGLVQAQSCPSSHPFACGGACYTDAAQATAGGCKTGTSSSKAASATATSSAASSMATCASETNPSHVISGRRTEFTQSWCDTVCVTYVGNDTACLNKAGTLVSNGNVCSDPANAKEAILDIEYNLHIKIDDQFKAAMGYQGPPPSTNPRISYADAKTYFVALLGQERGTLVTNQLNTNGDGWIDRNEATAAKGADPRQLLGTGFGCGLSTDDIMSYIGLYMGDGAIDKYGGDLDPVVKANMLSFTRSWQPGVHAQGCEYRGGCSGVSSSKSSSSSSKAASSSSKPASSSSKPASSSSKAASSAPANSCPVNYPYYSTSCQRCFVDKAQATSGGCN